MDYISIPFRDGGLYTLLGGAIALSFGEFLIKLGSNTLGPYGGVPGFLILIGIFCVCFQYSSSVLRAFYSGAKTLPFPKTQSIYFVDLIESLSPIFIGTIYAFFHAAKFNIKV